MYWELLLLLHLLGLELLLLGGCGLKEGGGVLTLVLPEYHSEVLQQTMKDFKLLLIFIGGGGREAGV